MVSEVTSSIAEAVRRRRESLGMTQEQLAQKAHLNRTYISDIERGTRNFSVGIFDRLANALSVSPSALWKSAEDNRKSSATVQGISCETPDEIVACNQPVGACNSAD